jgi:hypothetical protein
VRRARCCRLRRTTLRGMPCRVIRSERVPAMPEPQGDGAGRSREGWGRERSFHVVRHEWCHGMAPTGGSTRCRVADIKSKAKIVEVVAAKDVMEKELRQQAPPPAWLTPQLLLMLHPCALPPASTYLNHIAMPRWSRSYRATQT